MALRHRPRVMVVAGESSGDQLGAALMGALRVCHPEISFSGVGGTAMAAEGLVSQLSMAEIGLHGIIEVVWSLRRVLGHIRWLTDFAIETRPDVIVLIDIPDFNHRLARQIRSAWPTARILCYGAPTIWVWRRGRGAAMRGVFDHVMALFPFEPEIFADIKGPCCTYVGHPAIMRVANSDMAAAFRARHRISSGTRLVSILPGSRARELAAHRIPFAAAVREIATADIRFAIPVVSQVSDATRNWGAELEASLCPETMTGPIIYVENDADKPTLYRASDLALAASGTVSLELGLAGTPMVVGYRTDWLLAMILRRVARVPSMVLVNIILDRPVVPEFLQERCTGTDLAAALRVLLEDKDTGSAMRAQLVELADMMALPSSMSNLSTVSEPRTPAACAATVVSDYLL